jgi:hypothetical protein
MSTSDLGHFHLLVLEIVVVVIVLGGGRNGGRNSAKETLRCKLLYAVGKLINSYAICQWLADVDAESRFQDPDKSAFLYSSSVPILP